MVWHKCWFYRLLVWRDVIFWTVLLVLILVHITDDYSSKISFCSYFVNVPIPYNILHSTSQSWFRNILVHTCMAGLRQKLELPGFRCICSQLEWWEEPVSDLSSSKPLWRHVLYLEEYVPSEYNMLTWQSLVRKCRAYTYTTYGLLVILADYVIFFQWILCAAGSKREAAMTATVHTASDFSTNWVFPLWNYNT